MARLEAETESDRAARDSPLLDLIDEFRLTVVPAVIGGGTPYFLPGTDLRLCLAEQRPFGSGTVHLHYVRTDA